MFILLCSPHSFLLIELLTPSLILISVFFLVALSLKSPTRGMSINYCIVLLLYCNVTCLGMGIHCKYILILKTRVHLRTFNNGHVPSKQILFHHCPCHIQTLQVWSQGPVPSLQSLLHYKKTERL